MREFIEELENNQKINLEKGLENRVDIDYVIERLKNIDMNNRSTCKFFEDVVYDITEDYRTNENKKYDIEKTVENLIDDDELWQDLTNYVWNNLVEIKEEV